MDVRRHTEEEEVARLVCKGKCELCGDVTTKAQMSRHLASCAPPRDGKGPRNLVIQLRLEAAGDPRYWLHVEARQDATLKQLDALLRHVWLECCDHMSTFRVGGGEPSIGSKLGAVFHSEGLRFEYEYDFGSTTALKGQVLATREGAPGRNAVRILARNTPPQWPCATCGAEAAVLCSFCAAEGDCFFCEKHAGAHPCAEDEAFLPVVNSPRMGVCGYTGAD
jgi:hypothetical protein